MSTPTRSNDAIPMLGSARDPALPAGTADAQEASQEVAAHDRALLEVMVQMSLRLRLRGVDLESATGLTGRELDLVALLASSGPTSVKSLIADLHLPRSTMTAIVDRLEQRGLVMRHENPDDRRSVILEPMPSATDALLRYRDGMLRFIDHIEEALGDEEKRLFTRTLQKIAHTL